MVTHYKVSGHLACGSHGEKLASTTELAKVKCRNCRKTEVFTEARRNARNAARRWTAASMSADGGTCQKPG